jgi:hypothetical protein
MGKKKEELKVPPRKHFTGFCYLTGAHVPAMTGKAWNDLADQHRFKWKRVGDPREGVHDLCGGGYEVHIG